MCEKIEWPYFIIALVGWVAVFILRHMKVKKRSIFKDSTTDHTTTKRVLTVPAAILAFPLIPYAAFLIFYPFMVVGCGVGEWLAR